MRTYYHGFIEKLTGIEWDKQRSLGDYWDALPPQMKTKTMREFLWKLALYPEAATEEELEELFRRLKAQLSGI